MQEPSHNPFIRVFEKKDEFGAVMASISIHEDDMEVEKGQEGLWWEGIRVEVVIAGKGRMTTLDNILNPLSN